MNPRIAFQGEPGAFSQEAIFETFSADTPTLPCHSFPDLFRAVATGDADLGMAPIENSTAGSINQSYDLLLDYDLAITREAILRVRHALLARAGVAQNDVRRVSSHPAALAQCEKFIAANGWEAVAAYDTAGAAQQLSASTLTDTAAIASETAARIYGLTILARDIQDIPNNFTRFVVIGKHAAPRSDNAKTSILFATRHVPGALYHCLGEFAARNINLTKLESRPDRKHPWHYIFYLDFEGHRDDSACRAALQSLQTQTTLLKILGSYPAAPIIRSDLGEPPHNGVNE
jgi:prephenate dehydratase